MESVSIEKDMEEAELREEGIELWASKPGCRTEALGSA